MALFLEPQAGHYEAERDLHLHPPLRYRNKTIGLPDGTAKTVLVEIEKGIDVRLALDSTRLALLGECNVIVFCSQDQDLSEAAREIIELSRREKLSIELYSAFPHSPTSQNRYGIRDTQSIRIDRATYDRCLDPRNYHLSDPVS